MREREKDREKENGRERERERDREREIKKDREQTCVLRRIRIEMRQSGITEGVTIIKVLIHSIYS